MYEEDGEVRVKVGDEPEVAVIPGSDHQYQLDSDGVLDMGEHLYLLEATICACL